MPQIHFFKLINIIRQSKLFMYTIIVLVNQTDNNHDNGGIPTIDWDRLTLMHKRKVAKGWVSNFAIRKHDTWPSAWIKTRKCTRKKAFSHLWTCAETESSTCKTYLHMPFRCHQATRQHKAATKDCKSCSEIHLHHKCMTRRTLQPNKTSDPENIVMLCLLQATAGFLPLCLRALSN